MKTLRRLKLTTLHILSLGFPLAWLAFSQQTSKTESPIDIHAYQDLMAHQVMDVDDLRPSFAKPAIGTRSSRRLQRTSSSASPCSP